MRNLISLIVVVISLAHYTSVWSHGGGLNRQGCHNQRSTGGYHCHRTSYTAPPPKSNESTSRENVTTSEVESLPLVQGVLPSSVPGRTNNTANVGSIGAGRRQLTQSAKPEYDPEVEEAQSYLSYLGFDVGPVDGLVGVRTLAAIRAYQRTRKLEPTGRVSAELLEHLAATIDPGPETRKETRESTVKTDLVERTQFYLKVLELYDGENNGVRDVELDQAIMRFQNANRISVDGKLSYELLSQIKSVLQR